MVSKKKKREGIDLEEVNVQFQVVEVEVVGDKFVQTLKQQYLFYQYCWLIPKDGQRLTIDLKGGLAWPGWFGGAKWSEACFAFSGGTHSLDIGSFPSLLSHHQNRKQAGQKGKKKKKEHSLFDYNLDWAHFRPLLLHALQLLQQLFVWACKKCKGSTALLTHPSNGWRESKWALGLLLLQQLLLLHMCVSLPIDHPFAKPACSSHCSFAVGIVVVGMNQTAKELLSICFVPQKLPH